MMQIDLPEDTTLFVGTGIDVAIDKTAMDPGGTARRIVIRRRRRDGLRLFLKITVLPLLGGLALVGIGYVLWTATEGAPQVVAESSEPPPRATTPVPYPRAVPPRVEVPPAEAPRQNGADPFGG